MEDDGLLSKEGLLSDDSPPQPLKRSFSYYAAMLLVLPVRAIPLLSWVALSFQLWRNGVRLVGYNASALEKVGVLWALIEAIFSLHHWHLVDTLSRLPPGIDEVELSYIQLVFNRIVHLGLHDTHEGTNRPGSSPQEHVRNKLNLDAIPHLAYDDPRAVDFRSMLRIWFRGSSWSSLSREHMLSWLSWCMFSSAVENISAEQRELVERTTLMMERRAGARLPEEKGTSVEGPKKEDDIKPLRLTLDPMSVQSRPLIAYAVINLARFATHKWLESKYDVEYEVIGETTFLIRVVPGGSKEPPILFLQGLGVGLSQYAMFISAILGSPDLSTRTILVPLQPHISQQIFNSEHLKPPKRKNVIRDLREAIVEYSKGREKSAVVVSHSNGTVLHAWLLKAHPEVIRASCFIDPVTFCLWEGDVCYNFVYKEPTNGLELLMRYYVGSEIGLANYIQRNFDWSANTLFFEEIPHAHDPEKTMFVVGGKDPILSGQSVRRYLKLHAVTEDNMIFTPNARHGGALIMGGEVMNRIMDWVKLEHPV